MAAVAGNNTHVVAVPFPAQGHVKPLMTLCREIAKHGIKVTFVVFQSVHDKLLSASKMSREEEYEDNIVLAAVPDGLTPGDDPINAITLVQSYFKTMPEALADFIERINGSNPNQKVTCVITDYSFDRIFDVAQKMGAEPVGFVPSPMATLAMLQHIPKLLEEGILDADGAIKDGEAIRLSDDIPAFRRDELPWICPGDPETQKFFFEITKKYKIDDKTKWILCNSCYDLEPAACALLPHILPVGPLHLYNSNTIRSCSVPSSFYSEDANCVSWLDTKPDGSVIYISFGSTSVFSQQQLDELALGLELSGRPFLWVARHDIANGSQIAFPDGYLERVGELGKVVDWAPQEKVLLHPSIGCFVSHCGWNSILESVGSGVPFLCWPFFTDQLHNERYIRDKWENGLSISFDDKGIRSKYEIKKKIDMVFSDNKFKENALQLKETCGNNVSKGGSSYKNLDRFIDHLKK